MQSENGWPCSACNKKTIKTVKYGHLEVPLCSSSCHAKVGQQYNMSEQQAALADVFKFNMFMIGSYMRTLADRCCSTSTQSMRNSVDMVPRMTDWQFDGTNLDDAKEELENAVRRIDVRIANRETLHNRPVELANVFATRMELFIDHYVDALRDGAGITEASAPSFRKMKEQLVDIVTELQAYEKKYMPDAWLESGNTVVNAKELSNLASNLVRSVQRMTRKQVMGGRLTEANMEYVKMQTHMALLGDKLSQIIGQLLPDWREYTEHDEYPMMSKFGNESNMEMDESVQADIGGHSVARNEGRNKYLKQARRYFYRGNPASYGATTGPVIDMDELRSGKPETVPNYEHAREKAYEYPANKAALDYVMNYLSKDYLVVVMHALSYCPACKKMHPRVESIADQMDDVVFVYNAVDLQVPVPDVRKVPDVRVYRNGQMVDRFVGSRSKSETRAMLAKLVDKHL